MNDWTDEIAKEVKGNFDGRKVVIWGYYQTSITLKEILGIKYGIQIEFYIDSNDALVDDRLVFSPNILIGSKQKYYIIVPLPFYQDIKDFLKKWGTDKKDYCYFNDCIVNNDKELYLDKHGNRIISPPKNVRFYFTGYDNYIDFSRSDGHFSYLSISMGSSNSIVISGEKIRETNITLGNNNNFELKENGEIGFSNIFLGSNNNMIIGSASTFEGNVRFEGDSELLIGEESLVSADFSGRKCRFRFGNRILTTGNLERFLGFQQRNIFYAVEGGEVDVEDDCIISIGAKILCGDAHSIIDKFTGEKLNSKNKEDISVKLHKHVWIGQDVSLLDGTDIGEDCVVGTRSLVNKKYPPNCVIAGIPGKIIHEDRNWDIRWNLL